MKTSFKQIFNFLIVGTIAFIIDYSVLFILTEYFGILYLVAAGISFSISVIVNFYLSIKYVFNPKSGNKKEQFLIFLTTSLIGLLLNEVGLWIFVEKIWIDYKIAKIIMTAIVMVFNFVARKILFEKK